MKRNGFLLAMLLITAAVLWTVGCEDDGITAPSGSQIVVTANPGTVVLDPDGGVISGTSTITATVLDSQGFPLRDILVSFTTSGGSLLSGAAGGAPVQIKTGSNGTAVDTLTLNINDPDSVDVTASSSTVSDSVTVLRTRVEGAIFLDANPADVVIDPEAQNPIGTSTLTAQLVNSLGDPLAGETITFSSSAGTLASGGGGVTTDADGFATDVLTLDLNSPASVQVEARFSTLSATVEVTTTILGVNQLPTAVLVASPVQEAVFNQPVTFDGQGSNDPDGTITCWRWEVSSSLDPPSAPPEIVQGRNLSSITRRFIHPGFCSVAGTSCDSNSDCTAPETCDRSNATIFVDVILRVSDDDAAIAGCINGGTPVSVDLFSPRTDSITGYRVVCDTTDPLAEAGPPQSRNLGIATSVSFAMDGGGSIDVDGNIVEYRWDCRNNGPIVFGRQVNCVYDVPGGFPPGTTFPLTSSVPFTVQLQVTNECGLVDTDTVTLTVNP